MQIGVMMRSGRTRASGATDNPIRWNELREMAQLADDVGVDTLCIPDHLLFRNAGNVQLPAFNGPPKEVLAKLGVEQTVK